MPNRSAASARHPGTIEQLAEQRPDWGGEPIREWEEIADTYVCFDQEAETQVTDSEKMETVSTQRAYIRYPGFRVAPNTMRIRARGELFNILGAVNVNSVERWVMLTLQATNDQT